MGLARQSDIGRRRVGQPTCFGPYSQALRAFNRKAVAAFAWLVLIKAGLASGAAMAMVARLILSGG